MPCLSARPERGRTWPSWPSGSSMTMPQGTSARAPGSSLKGFAAIDGGEKVEPCRAFRLIARQAAGPAHAAAAGCREEGAARLPRRAAHVRAAMSAAMRSTRRRATSALSSVGQSSTPSTRHEMNRVALASHDAGVPADIVGDDHVAAFLRELGARMLEHFLGLGREADDEARAARMMADGRQNVGVLDQGERRRAGRSLS